MPELSVKTSRNCMIQRPVILRHIRSSVGDIAFTLTICSLLLRFEIAYDDQIHDRVMQTRLCQGYDSESWI